MTTATDYPDVQVDNPDTGEVYPSQILDHVARLDGAAAEAPALTAEDAVHLAARNADLEALAERLGRENAELRARMGAWTPPQSSLRRRHLLDDTPRAPRHVAGVDDLTGTEQRLAMVAPAPEYDDKDGVPLTPIGDADTWPTWLGEVHHADATWQQAVTDLRSWADGYQARPVEHTTAERVEISDEYAEKRLAVELQYRGLTSADSVYSQLAPENIAAEDGPPHRIPPPPPPPADRSDVERLAKRVPTALTTGEQPTQAETPEPPRVGGWRVWAASIAAGAALAAVVAAFGWWVA